ncbi:MAG: LCP family protein [Anaerolineales bacterium]|nr:LCP family protein [Anaerolineales bacterium]
MRTRKRRRGCGCGFGVLFLSLLGIGLLLGVYLFAPIRTNILLLGIDYAPPDSAVGRSDTIVLTTFVPLKPYVGLLSIPRDLWVFVPGVGENRINTAHFFAEAQQAGSGPLAVEETIQQNFGVDVDYYIRIRFEGFREVVNALGGVDIYLPKPMAGYPAGFHHLTGNKALAFTRHRLGADDFFRMEQGQLLLKAVFTQMISPKKWIQLPSVLMALTRVVDTDIPWWQWPRLSLALLRAGPEGLDARIVSRDMVTPYTTSQGAYVLLPNWAVINPVLFDLFGQ